jgi:hypothetical protein
MHILKTILIIVLLPVFLLANTGIAVAYHYCAGELDSISLTTEATCPCGEKETKSDCCTSKVSVLKTDTDLSFSSASIHPPVPVDCAILPDLFFFSPVLERAPILHIGDSSPPGVTDIPVRLCSLLI